MVRNRTKDLNLLAVDLLVVADILAVDMLVVELDVVSVSVLAWVAVLAAVWDAALLVHSIRRRPDTVAVLFGTPDLFDTHSFDQFGIPDSIGN